MSESLLPAARSVYKIETSPKLRKKPEDTFAGQTGSPLPVGSAHLQLEHLDVPTQGIVSPTMSVDEDQGAVLEDFGTLRGRLVQAEQRLVLLESELAEAQLGQQQLQQYAGDFRRIYSEARRRLQQMTILYEISTAVSATVDPAEVVSRASAGVRQLLPDDTVALYLLDAGGRRLRRRALLRAASPVRLPPTVPLGEGPLGRSLAEGRMVLEGHGEPNGPVTGAPWTLALPLVAGAERLGWLLVLRHAAQPFADDECQLVGMVASQAAMALQNARLATTDSLTGLYNRRYFEQALALECERARRARRPLGLLVLDVDHFKRFNDRFGHPAGDAVLRTVATTLTGGLRRTDILARIGGEEFAAILPDQDYDRVTAAAERLRRIVEGRPNLTFEGANLPNVRISVGGASLSAAQLDPEALIGTADHALRLAKRGGRNRSFVVQVGAGGAPLKVSG